MQIDQVPRRFCAAMSCQHYNPRLQVCILWQPAECKYPNHEVLIDVLRRSQYLPNDQEDDGEVD